MKVYKLFKPDMTTYEGYEWKVGRRETILSRGKCLCSRDVFHGYRSPELAVLLNPIHANYNPAVLFVCEVPKIVVDDGTKIGFKSCVPLNRVSMPEVTTIISVTFGILSVLAVSKDKNFKKWAHNWLSGKNRSSGAAAYAAAYAAAPAAAHAADGHAGQKLDLGSIAKQAFGEQGDALL